MWLRELKELVQDCAVRGCQSLDGTSDGSELAHPNPSSFSCTYDFLSSS